MNFGAGGSYDDPFAHLDVAARDGSNNAASNTMNSMVPPQRQQQQPNMTMMNNMPPQTAQTGSMASNQQSDDDDDDDFGDFASASGSLQPHPFSPAASLNLPGVSSKDTGGSGTDDDDFGDFEDAQQFPDGQQPQQSQPAMSNMNMMAAMNPMQQQQQQAQTQPMSMMQQQPQQPAPYDNNNNNTWNQQPVVMQQQQQQSFGAPYQQQQQQQQVMPTDNTQPAMAANVVGVGDAGCGGGFVQPQPSAGGMMMQQQQQQQQPSSADAPRSDRPPSMVMGSFDPRLSTVSALTTDEYDDVFAGLEPAQTDWKPTASLQRIVSEGLAEEGGENEQEDDDDDDDDFGDFCEADTAADADTAPPNLGGGGLNQPQSTGGVLGPENSAEFSLAETAPANLASGGGVIHRPTMDRDGDLFVTAAQLPTVETVRSKDDENDNLASPEFGRFAEANSTAGVESAPPAMGVGVGDPSVASMDVSQAETAPIPTNGNNSLLNPANSAAAGDAMANNKDGDPFGAIPVAEPSGAVPVSSAAGVERQSTGPLVDSDDYEKDEEEFGDFGTSATHPPPRELTASGTAGLSSANAITTESDDPFAHLDTPAEQPLPTLSGLSESAVTATSTIPETQETNKKTEEEDDDEFGDFDAAPQQDAVPNSNDDNDFGDFGSAEQPLSSNGGQANHDDDDPFGHLDAPEQPSVPALSELASVPGSDAAQQADTAPPPPAEVEDEDFGDFGSAEQNDAADASSPHNHDDPFGHLDTPEQEALPPVSGLAAVDSGAESAGRAEDVAGGARNGASGEAAPRNEAAANDDEDEFGDFGSAELSPPGNNDPFGHLETPQQGDRAATPPSGDTTNAEPVADKDPVDDGDDDDFGDFSAAIMTETAPTSDETDGVVSGELGSAEQTSTDAQNDNDDPFGHLETPEQPPLPSLQGFSTGSKSEDGSQEYDVTEIQEDAVNGGDDFGDFSGADKAESGAAGGEGQNQQQTEDHGPEIEKDGGFETAQSVSDAGESDDMDLPLEDNLEDYGLSADTDDFGEFSSDQLAEGNSPSNKQAGQADEMFGDFESATFDDAPSGHLSTAGDAASAQKVQQPETHGREVELKQENGNQAKSAVSPGDEEDAEFGDFGSAPIDKQSDAGVDGSEGLGDFGSAQASEENFEASKDENSSDQFGSSGAAPNQHHADTKPEVKETIQSPSVEADEDFGDFGSAEEPAESATSLTSPQEVTKSTEGQPMGRDDGKSNDKNDDDYYFGDFDSAQDNFEDVGETQEELEQALQASAPADGEEGGEDDEFGDFDQSPADSSILKLSERENHAPEEEEDDDFGDFDSAPNEPSAPAKETTSKTESASHVVGDGGGGGADDEDDDFGDFDSAPNVQPRPATQQQTPPQRAAPAPVAVPVENNLVHKLTKMSFEKLFGQYLEDLPKGNEKDDAPQEEVESVGSFLDSLETQDFDQPSPNLRALQKVLTQTSRPATSDKDKKQLLFAPDREPNPYLYPSQGFSSSDLLNPSRKPHDDDRPKLPDVLDVNLSGSEEAPDLASPETEPRQVVEPQEQQREGTIVDLPPLNK